MDIPFRTRTINAPRGPRSGRPAVALQQLLDLDRTLAEQQAVTLPPASAPQHPGLPSLILVAPAVRVMPIDMLQPMQASGLLHVAAQAGSVVVLTSHPDH